MIGFGSWSGVGRGGVVRSGRGKGGVGGGGRFGVRGVGLGEAAGLKGWGAVMRAVYCW